MTLDKCVVYRARLLFAVPNVTADPPKASVPT